MPLRCLLYVSSLYSQLIDEDRIYGGSLISIPEPHFVVFYNGTDEMPEEKSYHKAVPNAIDYCIKHDILKDFLIRERKAVIMYSLYEYNQAGHMKAVKEEALEQGKDIVNELNSILIEAGRMDDLKRATKDKEYQKQLIEELVSKKKV